ncbi:hypothetical protein JL11_16985 [Brevundimonas sp. DS20]|nr:hypothetical protein JL11_16985 [Brevundimonas sp. DS20]
MKHMHIGVRVARQVQTAEHAIDNAMIEVCKLIQTSIEGRMEARVAAEVGQTALENIVNGLQGLTAVRASVAVGHAGLSVVADQQGIGWRLDGMGESKSDPKASADVLQFAA